MLHLVHCALARVFVGTPPKKFCAMPKPAAGEMVVGNFHDNFRINWFPFACAIRAPTAGSSGRVAGESGWFLQRFEFFCELPAFRCLERRGESDVMEQPVVSIQAEQKRTYYALALGVTKSTNDTISGPDLLYLNCRGAFTGSIPSVQTLRDDAVKVAAGSFEPFVGKAEISRRWRKPHIFSRSEIPTRKLFEKFPAFAQRLLQVRSFTLREKIEYDVCRRMRFGSVSERDLPRDANAVAIHQTKARHRRGQRARRLQRIVSPAMQPEH